MAYENPGLVVSFPAGEDLSADQYRFVVLTSTGTVRRPDAATEVAVGVLQNAPASGEAASVMVSGISKIQLGATLAVGALVAPEYTSASDAGNAAANATTRYAAGMLVQGGADGDLGSVPLGSITVTV